MPLHCLLSPSPPPCPIPKTLTLKSQPHPLVIVAATRRRYSSSRSKPPSSSSATKISQVHSYGTVDFELRPSLRWSSLYRRIATGETAGLGPRQLLEEWDGQERRLTKWEIIRISKELRKFRRYNLGLQVYQWMTEQGERFEVSSSDMAIQLDLIYKARGVPDAESYFEKIPQHMKDKRTYGALLGVYGQAKMKEKGEATIKQMRQDGHAIDTLPYNVMMTLYMDVGEHDKVIEIIDEMKEKKVMLDAYSYNIWITNCAAMKDEAEMERIFGLMTADSNVTINWTTYTTLATMYVRLGNFEKAENCLKETERRMTCRNKAPFHYLIGLYGTIGKKEEVYRIWNWYKVSFRSILNLGYQSMLSSLLRLGDPDGAEMIFDEWMSNTASHDPKLCNILLGWYARRGSLVKARHILNRFIENGGKPKPAIWENLSQGYIKDKQLGEALSCMKEAALFEGTILWRPKPENIADFLTICEEQKDTESKDALMDILISKGFHEDDKYKSFISNYALATFE